MLSARFAEKDAERAKTWEVAGMTAHLRGDGAARLELRFQKGRIPSCSAPRYRKVILLEGSPEEFEMLIDTIRSALKARIK